jgi:hypothetical protein
MARFSDIADPAAFEAAQERPLAPRIDDALRRALESLDAERLARAAAAINLIADAVKAAGRPGFTAQDVEALGMVLRAADLVAAKRADPPADYALQRGRGLGMVAGGEADHG